MKIEVVPPILPGGRPPLAERLTDYDWSSLIEKEIHEVKVAVVEALDWIGGPLSAKELHLILDERHRYQTVAHHINGLAKQGVIEQTHVRPARGAEEKYYLLAQVPSEHHAMSGEDR
jgi:hypothetical protein